MEEGLKETNQFSKQKDQFTASQNYQQDMQQAQNNPTGGVFHPQMMEQQHQVNNYVPNQFFGQNYNDPQTAANSVALQQNQYFNVQPQTQVNPMQQYQGFEDGNNHQSIYQQQWVPVNQSSNTQSQDQGESKQRIADYNQNLHISPQTSDQYPQGLDTANLNVECSLQIQDQNFQTPTKLIITPQDSLTHVRFGEKQVMSTEMVNNRKQWQTANQAQKLIANQKIPQSAHINRKISYNYHGQQQNIVFQEGNHDIDSVNNLTDIQDPSNETNSVVEKNIIDILNDDHLSYTSDKNIKTTKRTESLEKDNCQPLVQNINKGSNSVNDQGFYIPRDGTAYMGPNENHQLQQQHFMPNTMPIQNNFDQNSYPMQQQQLLPDQTNQSIQDLSGKISNDNRGNQFGQKQFIPPNYNAELLQQNQEFNINKLHQMNQGQYNLNSRRAVDQPQSFYRNPNQQNMMPQMQSNFTQQPPQFQNNPYMLGQGQMMNNQVQQMQVMDQQEQFMQMNAMRQQQKQPSFTAMYNNQLGNNNNMHKNLNKPINPNHFNFSEQRDMGHSGYQNIQPPYQGRVNSHGEQSIDEDYTIIKSGLSDINISDNHDNERKGRKFMSEKSSKIQAEFKDRNRQEENLDYIKPKNNSHSRLQVWQGANSQLNYRNPKEIDSLPVSNEGIAEDEQQKYRKKGSQHSSYGTRQINRQGMKENNSAETNEKNTLGGEYTHTSHDFINSGSGGTGSQNQRGSQGGPTGKTTVTNYSNQGSRESYDEFIHQIQHEIKKANDDPDKEFEVLQGNVMKLAQKKVGSQFLQEHLKKAQQSLTNRIIDEIDGHVAELMMDNYGNYFCSQLIQYLQPHQRIHFLTQIKGDKFIKISCNSRGTHALQYIINAVTEKEEFDIIKETLVQNNNIVRLAKDKMGQHMVQMIIQSFKEQSLYYIFDEIIDNFQDLATDKQGLCVMKKLIEKTKTLESQTRIVNKIQDKILMYVQNEFGNFVVSEALEYFPFDVCKGIFTSIEGNFVKLSQNKYSSKFIENCINHAPTELKEKIINEFVVSEQLSKVVESNFGNYVLQNTLEDYLDKKSHQTKYELIKSIINCLLSVKEYKVRQKWGEKILKKHLEDNKSQSVQEISDNLERVMIESENMNKSQKHQQTQKMSKMRTADRESGKIMKQSSGSNSSGNAGYLKRQPYYDPYEQDNQYGGPRHQPQSGTTQQAHYDGSDNQRRGKLNKAKKQMKYNIGKGDKIIIDKNNIKFADKKNF